jgi:hypothetical protein
MTLCLFGLVPGGARADDPPPDWTGPWITSFTWMAQPGGYTVFTGHVVQAPPGTVVNLTGNAGSFTVTVNEEGGFSKALRLPPGSNGTESAEAVAPDGSHSNTLTDFYF